VRNGREREGPPPHAIFWICTWTETTHQTRSWQLWITLLLNVLLANDVSVCTLAFVLKVHISSMCTYRSVRGQFMYILNGLSRVISTVPIAIEISSYLTDPGQKKS